MFNEKVLSNFTGIFKYFLIEYYFILVYLLPKRARELFYNVLLVNNAACLFNEELGFCRKSTISKDKCLS